MTEERQGLILTTIGIVILILSLIAILGAHGNEKRKRRRELDRIQRRLAEKEKETSG